MSSVSPPLRRSRAKWGSCWEESVEQISRKRYVSVLLIGHRGDKTSTKECTKEEMYERRHV